MPVDRTAWPDRPLSGTGRLYQPGTGRLYQPGTGRLCFDMRLPYAELPYAEVELGSTGAPRDPARCSAALDLVIGSGATDVLVLAHGWSDGVPAARRCYQRLAGSVAAVRPAVPAAAGRSLAVIGVHWPSVPATTGEEAGGRPAEPVDETAALMAAIERQVEDPRTAVRLMALVPKLAYSAPARRDFLALLRDQLPGGRSAAPATSRGGTAGDEDPPPGPFLTGDPEQVFAAVPPAAVPPAAVPPAVVLPAVVPPAVFPGTLLPGVVLRKAGSLLDLATYFLLKARAGQVGAGGVADLLAGLATRAPRIRRHLAGHSFGARVVSAAAAGGCLVHSLTLLEGALSQHGFAVNYDQRGSNGSFRQVLTSGTLAGPLLVIHTRNTAASPVGPVASRLAGHRPAGPRGADPASGPAAGTAEPDNPDDPYGMIGRNGAQQTPEVFRPTGELRHVGEPYAFQRGKVYNLKADPYIRSPDDTTTPQVAYALLSAISGER